jgi:hypothetical protein
MSKPKDESVIEFADVLQEKEEVFVQLIEGKRILGKLTYAGPILRFPARTNQRGEYPEGCLIYDASQPNNQISFNGTPMLLSDEEPLYKEAIMTLAGLQNDKSPTRWAILMEGNPKQLFRVVELQKQAKEMFAKEQAAFKDMEMIVKMKDDEAVRYGVLLGLSGRPESIKTAMMTMLRNDQQKKMLKKFIDMNEDERFIKVLLISCIKKGSADIKKGIYQNHIGVYYNEKMLGSSLDDATAKILGGENKLDMIKIMKTISETK